jgi:amino acid transporter
MLFSCGELVAFCCVCTLILEYVLANAAVARSFAPYLGQLIGKGSNFFTFEISGARRLAAHGWGAGAGKRQSAAVLGQQSPPQPCHPLSVAPRLALPSTSPTPRPPETLTIDPLAAGLVFLCVALATVSTTNSSWANIGINAVCLTLIFIVRAPRWRGRRGVGGANASGTRGRHRCFSAAPCRCS